MIKLRDPIIAVMAIMAFYYPLIFSPELFLIDDIVKEFLPKLISISKAYQSAELPLLNKGNFFGGNPFYADLENLSYNLLLLPFFFIANHTTVLTSLVGLVIIPFFIAIILSYYGCFRLGREIFFCSRIEAHLLSIIYVFSPSFFVDGLFYFPELCFYAALPLTVLFLHQNKKEFSLHLIAILLFANLSGSFKQFIRFTMFLMIYMLVFSFFKRKPILLNKKNLKNLFIALLLSSILWLPQLEGVTWLIENDTLNRISKLEFYPIISYLYFIFPFLAFCLPIELWERMQLQVGGEDQLFLTGSLSFVIFFVAYLYKIKKRQKTSSFIAPLYMIFFIMLMLSFEMPFISQLISFPHPTYFRFSLCFSFSLLLVLLINDCKIGKKKNYLILVVMFEVFLTQKLNFNKTYLGKQIYLVPHMNSHSLFNEEILFPLTLDISNMSVYFGAKSLFGYDARPLVPRLQKLYDLYNLGLPQKINFQDQMTPFLHNMRVTGFLAPSSMRLESNDDKLIVQEFGEATQRERMVQIFKYKKIISLPEYFFQSKIINDDNSQSYFTSMKDYIFLEREVDIHSEFDYEELNRRNQVIRMREKEASLTVNVVNKDKTILVTPFVFHEGWRLSSPQLADVELIEVNKLWLGLMFKKSGDFIVELKFRPIMFYLGACISFLTFIFLIFKTLYVQKADT